MALKFKVESLDGIDEAMRTLYAQKEDGFELQVEGLPDVQGLNVALGKEREEVKTLRTKLKGFDGIDVEEYKTLKASKADIEREKKLAEGKVNEVVASMQKEFDKERGGLRDALTQLTTERDGLSRQIRRNTIEQALEKSYSEAKGKASYLDDWKRRADEFGIFDGKVYQLDEDGESPRRHPKEALRFVEPKDVLGELSKVKTDWFEGSGGGGGGGGDRRPPAGARVVDRDDHAGFLRSVNDIAKGDVGVR